MRFAPRRLTRSALSRPALATLTACALAGCSLWPTTRPDPVEPLVEAASVRALRAPESLCATSSTERAAPASPVKGVPEGALSVSWGTDPQLVTLEADGVRLGRVLAEIGRRTDQLVMGLGDHADVRVWAHVRKPRPWRVLVEQLAASVGARTMDSGDVLLVLDEAAWRERMKSMQTGSPIEVTRLDVSAPEEVASAIAAFALSCRGEVSFRSDEDVVFVRDASEFIGAAEGLAAFIEGIESGQQPKLPDPARRAGPRTPEPIRCEESGARSDETLGGVIVEAAKAARKEAIVGCGGGVRVHTALTSRATPASLASAARLVGSQVGDVWSTRDALGDRQDEVGPMAPTPAREVFLVESADPELDAELVSRVLGERDVIALPSRGAILLSASPGFDPSLVEKLLDAPDASGDR